MLRSEISPQKKAEDNPAPNSQMPKKPILTYYKIRGICQPIRNILKYINIDFNDCMIDRIEQDSDKKVEGDANLFDSGLPVFEDEFLKISNSIAIAMYICQRYEKFQLLGDCLYSRSKVNQIMFKYSLEMSKIVPSILEIVFKSSSLENHTKSIFIQQSLKKLLSDSKFLSFCIKRFKIDKNWILQKLTIVDFYFYEACFYICGFFKNEIQGIGEIQEFQQYTSFAQSLFVFENSVPRSEEKISNLKQEAKIFFHFKNLKMREAIQRCWIGPKQNLFV